MAVVVMISADAEWRIDRWLPGVLINLGTCGGFAGEIMKGEVVLAERTLVYDIVEAIGSHDEAIGRYATTLDLSWLGPHPHAVRRTLLISADRDLVPDELARLRERYAAIAGDWESGAIAYVAARNAVRCLILRGVSDLVSPAGGEAYGSLRTFVSGADAVMRHLLTHLPGWIAASLPM